MELFIFARFHARNGNELEVQQALTEVVSASRQEPGCLSIYAFRATRDPQLFFIHSRWKDEEAFETHAALPHTLHFVEVVEPLIDHALDVTRANLIA
jgi:quinol monooxygenase YgiN